MPTFDPFGMSAAASRADMIFERRLALRMRLAARSVSVIGVSCMGCVMRYLE
jgi:uncharacterized membrane protein